MTLLNTLPIKNCADIDTIKNNEGMTETEKTLLFYAIMKMWQKEINKTCEVLDKLMK